jgi:putative oxidoreductase
MMPAMRFNILSHHAGAGNVAAAFLRIFFGAILIYGTQDNVFSREQMLEFVGFVEAHGFPYPAFSARLSVYAQFSCGVLLMLGALTRPAAAVMAINFIVALVMVHVGLPFSANIAPFAMLALAIFFGLSGSGPYAVDRVLVRKLNPSAGQPKIRRKTPSASELM